MHNYEYPNRTGTWFEAREYCRSKSRWLAMPQTVDEFGTIGAVMYRYDISEIFLGFHSLLPEHKIVQLRGIAGPYHEIELIFKYLIFLDFLPVPAELKWKQKPAPILRFCGGMTNTGPRNDDHLDNFNCWDQKKFLCEYITYAK